MIQYVDVTTIIFINKKTLELTNESNFHHVLNYADLNLINDFVMERFNENIIKKALAYLVSIIVLHPFQNGNHRTSLETSEQFLLMNDYEFIGSYIEKINFEKWRMGYEKTNELERSFFSITCNENNDKKKDEIENVMNSEYGQTIEQWLIEYYKKI